MVAGLLSHPKRRPYSPENNRHSFFFYYENSSDTLYTLLTKMPAEEQIFTETSRSVPLTVDGKTLALI